MVFGNVTPAGEETAGYSYRALVVRAQREEVVDQARMLRVTGWVGPQEGPHVVVVAEGERLLVAKGGRDLEDVGAALSVRGPVLLVTVLRDRLLALVLLRSGQEPLRYLSEPSVLDPEDYDEPRGQHHAHALAGTFGVPEAAAELRAVLGEALDPEHYIESERLGRVLALLELPGWLVSSWTLPRAMSVGPAPSQLVRLRAGRTGVAGLLASWPASRGRRLRQTLSRRPDGPRPDGLAAGPPGDFPPEDVPW